MLGLLFGAASVYLALRVGLTTSASIPIAVMAITILKRLGRSSILENNVVQTAGSAGESIAAAVVFTVPAVLLLGYPLRPALTLLLALVGGLLGVLMMIPLRRYLIVKEHENLRFPEGRACAEILVAGEKGGTTAAKVFAGLGIGALYKAMMGLFGFWRAIPSVSPKFYPGSQLAAEVSPELLGVGYIIGWRTSVIMVAGGLLSWWILIPMIVFFGRASGQPLYPATRLIAEMTPDDIWRSYVRYIGAGAVATGGILGLARASRSIWNSLTASVRQLALERGGRAGGGALRTERDTPITVVAFGSLALVALLVAIPVFKINVFGAALVVLFGFLFSAVSARITGIVGSSSSPLSGMTIAVLMGTCLLFLVVGWEGASYTVRALLVGAVVCVAISNAGTTAQDLKTGHLVGATPWKQQLALLFGVVTSASVVGFTLVGLNESYAKEERLETPFAVPNASLESAERMTGRDGEEYLYVKVAEVEGIEPGNFLVDPDSGRAVLRRVEGIGGARLSAPQANLMAVVTSGLLERKLPWGLILIGVAIAVFIELMGMHALTFAVGVYLPLSSTFPIFLGGCVRKLCDRMYRRPADDPAESEGTLFSSGLIAGGALVGILIAFLHFDWFGIAFDADRDLPTAGMVGPRLYPGLFDGPVSGQLLSLLAFGLLGFLLLRGARGPQGG